MKSINPLTPPLTLLLTLLASTPFTTAVPNVTVIPLNPASSAPSCTYWPGWIRTPSADITGNLRFQVAQADDPAINGLLTSTVTVPFPIRSNSTNTVTNVQVDLRASTRIAKPYYRCSNGKMRLGYALDTEISVSKDYRNAFMTLGGPESGFEGGPGYLLEPYAHEIGGVRQEGVFLGAQGKTTWGFRWRRPSCPAGGAGGQAELDWYDVKLVGLEYDPETESRAGYESEFQGFLKVIVI